MFDREDELLLGAFASLGGIAITNARQFTRQAALHANSEGPPVRPLWIYRLSAGRSYFGAADRPHSHSRSNVHR